MKVLHGCNALSQILGSKFLAKTTLLLKQRIDLTLGTVLQNKVKIIIVFIVIIQLQDMVVIQLVHYFDLKLYLLHKVVLKDLLFIDYLDSVNILRDFVSNFIHFTETSNSNVAIGK